MHSVKVLKVSTAAALLLLGSACVAPTEPLGDDPGTIGQSPSPREPSAPRPEGNMKCDVRTTASYVYGGPGGETPVEAAEMVGREFQLSLRSTEGREAQVNAVDPETDALERIYQVHESDGLWYPDGYVTCAG